MPIAFEGKIYKDSYDLEMGRPVPEEAPGETKNKGGTQVPPPENNASTGNVEGKRGIVDPLDYTGKYNTELSPEEQADYSKKFSPKDSYDYDMQGWYKANPGADPKGEGVHYPDTFKKPNHPTFSNQSQYNGVEGLQGGEWGEADGKNTFRPGRTNLELHKSAELQDYFKRVEPDANLLPPNIEDVPHHDWVESTIKGVAKGIVSAFKLPGEVLAGKIQPGTDEEFQRSLELAGMMVFGPAPVASKMAEGTLGSFAGVTSKTLNKEKLYAAQNLETAGASPTQIWQDTGFMRGADNRWRYEIDDSSAKFKDEALIMTKYSAERLKREKENPSSKGGGVEPSFELPEKGAKLADVLDHPELFEAYPHLKDIKVTNVNGFMMMNGVKGYFNAPKNVLAIAANTKDEMKSIAMHEIAHVIQKKEGFESGGNTEIFKTPRWKELHKSYTDLQKDIKGIINEYFPENPGKFNDLREAVLSEKDLPKIKKVADEGYSYSQKRYKRITENLELMDKVPQLREAMDKMVKGEEIVHKYDVELYEEYKKIMGEVEARNTQKRLDFTPEMRRAQPGFATEDTPRNVQIPSPLR